MSFCSLLSRSLRPVGRGAVVIAALFVLLATCARVALLIQARGDVAWDSSLLAAGLVGLGYDVATAVLASLPWLALASLVPSSWWPQRAGKIITMTLLGLYAGTLLFNGVAEWFFWDEFQVRYNFIAVDYLMWTQEVWGNIWESYNMPAIIAGLVAGSALTVWGLAKVGLIAWITATTETWKSRLGTLAAGIVLATLVSLSVKQSQLPAFANQYNRELGKNGLWSFGAAFWQMELDYEAFYRTLPGDKAFERTRELLSIQDTEFVTSSPRDLRRKMEGRGEEEKWNVILVCMESLSADFMGRFKNKKGLTPNLDQLSKESLFFTNLFATGTRTVRGMEALTLGLPPTPGQAIIYRPASVGLSTTFTPFIQRGYDCGFIYGGDGRFDYMNRYFGGAGARVIDKNSWKKEDITFETSWGACDEDLYRKTIAEADAAHAAGKPFHYFCMTTSNHRPFQFPSGKIDLPSDSGRNAAVKYHDYAIGQLVAAARTKPWFAKTLFIFCADHCASSAGKVEIDVTKFHIPAMIWNPGLIPAKEFKPLCSQIDVMPTVFGLMNWNWESRQFGQDLLAPGMEKDQRRAFVSNYQKVALLTKDHLAILKPKQEVSLYQCKPKTGELTPDASVPELLDDAAAYYQSAAWLFKSGGLRHTAPQP